MKRLLAFLSQKYIKPPLVSLYIAGLTDFLLRCTPFKLNSFSFRRYIKANRVLYRPSVSDKGTSSAIEILFVSTKKDFTIINHAVDSAIKANSEINNLQITIITPDKYFEELEALMQNYNVKVERESLFFDEDTLRKLNNSFPGRFGWVLQQLLKLRFVLGSQSAGVLIIDSDTLLLEKRNWLGNDGSQLLTPTWEYHKPYYEFLSSIGICGINPEYTFVSHHMLMQPKIVNELFEYVGWKDTSDLIDFICSIPIGDEQSPFSLDYELYAQYLYKNYPEKVILGKWSNKAVARYSLIEDAKLEISRESLKSKSFASLSFHSYLKAKAP